MEDHGYFTLLENKKDNFIVLVLKSPTGRGSLPSTIYSESPIYYSIEVID